MGPGLELEKYSKVWKHSKFLAHSNNVFGYGSMYIIEKKIDKKKTNFILFLACFFILSLTFYDHWPTSVKGGVYAIIFSYIIVFGFFYILRILLWIVGYHFGFSFGSFLLIEVHGIRKII